MPRCRQCGTSGVFLLLTGDGLCRPCEIERQISQSGDFHISKVFHIFLPNNYIFFLAVDDTAKRFAVCAQTMSKAVRVTYYNYTDLISFEATESETPKNMCNSMMMNIYFNSLERPHISFYLINSPVQFGGKSYHYAVRAAKKIQGMLVFLKHNGEAMRAVPPVAYAHQLEGIPAQALASSTGAAAYAQPVPAEPAVRQAAPDAMQEAASDILMQKQALSAKNSMQQKINDTVESAEGIAAKEAVKSSAIPEKEGKTTVQAESDAAAKAVEAIETKSSRTKVAEKSTSQKTAVVETPAPPNAPVQAEKEPAASSGEKKETFRDKLREFGRLVFTNDEEGDPVSETAPKQEPANGVSPAAPEATEEYEGGAITDSIIDALGGFAGKVSGFFKRDSGNGGSETAQPEPIADAKPVQKTAKAAQKDNPPKAAAAMDDAIGNKGKTGMPKKDTQGKSEATQAAPKKAAKK